jgi:hypothetical protein
LEHAWDRIAVNSFLGRLSGVVKCWGEAENFHDVSCRDFRETSVFDVRDSAHDLCGQFEMPVDAAANAAITPMRFDANAVMMASRSTAQTPGPLQAPSGVAGRVEGCNPKGCRIAGKF